MRTRSFVRLRHLFLSLAVLLVAAVLLGQPAFAASTAAKPTPRPRRTQTPANTPTRIPTNTPTAIPTNTPANTPTNTPANSPTPGPTFDPANPHKSITTYEGPQTCVACHVTEGDSAVHSEHVQWQGKWPQTNTYCTAPEPSEYQCLGCHATTGTVKPASAGQVDCLMCHSDSYAHAAGPLTGSIAVTDWQGTTKNVSIPEKNAAGDYTLLPVVPAGMTLLQVAQNPQLPTCATCLKCHAKAGGADGAKRGDISSANANPSLTSDVHMSPEGGNFACQTCHVTTDHQIPGKGIDLRISEGQPGAMKACADCHSAKPHSEDKLDKHTDHVACQTCHIPVYGKDLATEMSRDWTMPKWNSVTNQWVPEDTKALNVKPEYRWWNGTSYVYDLKDPISPNDDGTFTMSKANGAIGEVASKLYPIKLHTSNQPRHDASGRMVAYDTRWNFLTGKYEEAAQRGLNFMGLTGSYTWVTVKAEQLITHGVEPKYNALQCDTCHQNTSQMDLKALGYTLKGPESQVCTACHSQKPAKPFYDMHDKHVKDKGNDCSWCHTFSRPERGLRMP